MTILDTLLPASYKGVPFLVSKSDTDVGRKQAEYNYPFSDKKKIEDLGLKPRTYKLTCVIHGQGLDYTQRRTAFLSVLEDGKKGVLVHPFYGILPDMVARPTTITEDLTSAGVITVEVSFDKSDEVTQPEAVTNTLSEISGLNVETIDKIKNFMTDNLGATFVQNVQGAIENVKNVANFANGVVGGFNLASSSINSYQTIIDTMLNNPVSFALNSLGFSTATINLLNGLFDVLPEPKDVTRANRQYYNYGDGVTPVPETTPARKEYNNNQETLKVGIQCAALANSQLSATLETYATVTEIDNANAALEAQFNKVLTYDLDEDLLASLSNLRAIVNNYLEEQKLTAAQVVDIYTNELPAAVLSYQYYGTTDRADEIIALNNTPDVSFLYGDLSVLSQ